MRQSEAVHCKCIIDDFIVSFWEDEAVRPRVKVIQMHPTEEREDMWVVVVGIPLDAPFYQFDEEVNVGVVIEPKRDDVKLVNDVGGPMMPPGGMVS